MLSICLESDIDFNFDYDCHNTSILNAKCCYCPDNSSIVINPPAEIDSIYIEYIDNSKITFSIGQFTTQSPSTCPITNTQLYESDQQTKINKGDEWSLKDNYDANVKIEVSNDVRNVPAEKEFWIFIEAGFFES